MVTLAAAGLAYTAAATVLVMGCVLSIEWYLVARRRR